MPDHGRVNSSAPLSRSAPDPAIWGSPSSLVSGSPETLLAMYQE